MLAAFRVGVGIGEAGCSPPSHSLISDYFPPEKRGRALGIYAMATQAGGAFGWLLGGWLFYWLGWRWAFVAAYRTGESWSGSRVITSEFAARAGPGKLTVEMKRQGKGEVPPEHAAPRL